MFVLLDATLCGWQLSTEVSEEHAAMFLQGRIRVVRSSYVASFPKVVTKKKQFSYLKCRKLWVDGRNFCFLVNICSGFCYWPGYHCTSSEVSWFCSVLLRNSGKCWKTNGHDHCLLHPSQFVINNRAFIQCCITRAVGKNVSIIQCHL